MFLYGNGLKICNFICPVKKAGIALKNSSFFQSYLQLIYNLKNKVFFLLTGAVEYPR